jgi:hypothetical protein
MEILSILFLMAIVIASLFSAFRIYLEYKKKIVDRLPQQMDFRIQEVPKDIDNLSNLLIQNYRILNSFYAENLSQYRTTSITGIAISLLGFVVIIAGMLIALITDKTGLGAVSSAAGIVAQAAAMLFYRQNKAFQSQMLNSLNKLVSSQYLMTSIALARDLDEEAKRNEVLKINGHLRSLIDLLHGERGP